MEQTNEKGRMVSVRCDRLLYYTKILVFSIFSQKMTKDLREARERHGRNRSDEKWVLVEEVLANASSQTRPPETDQ